MKQNMPRSLMAVTFIATLLLAGCQKDTVTLRLRINNFGADGKVYMDGRLPRWSSTDELWVNGQDGYQLSLTNSGASVSVPNTPTYRAIYPDDIVVPANNTTNQNENTIRIQLPSVQIYEEVGGNQVVRAPMGGFASSGGIGSSVPMTFNNLGALLAINIQNNLRDGVTTLVIDDVVVSSADKTLPLWGNATISDISNPEAYYICDQPDPTDLDRDAYYSVTLARANNAPLCSELTVNSTMQVYIYVPSHGTLNNRYSITVHAHRGTEEYNQTKTQSSSQGGNLERSQMASVDFPMRAIEAPRGAVQGGTFTVGMDGSTPRKVYFAAGNLQYRRSNNTWRIASNQWEFIGNGNITSGNSSFNEDNSSNLAINNSNYTGWIDLFGWATSGYHDPNDYYNQRYMPYDYMSTQLSGANNINVYGYGPSVTTYTYEGVTYTPSTPNYLSGNNKNYDWGVYHSNTSANADNGVLQYNGSAVPLGVEWRTLTFDEWSYLLKTRSVNGASGLNHTFSRAIYKVNDDLQVEGFLIYPDNYTQQKPDNTVIESVPPSCVFLPTSGFRSISSSQPTYSRTNGVGLYWTASSSTGADPSVQKAVYAQFQYNLSNVITTTAIKFSQNNRYYGHAVRLVAPVE